MLWYPDFYPDLQSMHDPHSHSAFSPITPGFPLSHKARKENALAGQRAEIDHILQPEYKDGDSGSIAGPSRSTAMRTAGGLAGGEKKKTKVVGLGIRPSASLSNVKGGPNSASTTRMGVYIDSNGKIRDTEYDPFAGVSEISRRKSKRRSAFGPGRRRDSGSESSSASGSENGYESPRKSLDGGGGEEEEMRRRLEFERRRLDEVSGLTAARRRSMVSERSSAGGKATPSIRSSDDGFTSAQSTHLTAGNRSRSQQGYYVPSPLSPTFGQQQTNGNSYASRNLTSTAEMLDGVEESPPQKSTERTNGPTKEKPSMSISVTDRKITVTGFDAPVSNSPRPDKLNTLAAQFDTLKLPDSARLSNMSNSSSRRSTDSNRPKPAERPREEMFPETPAQFKRREERERRAGRTPAASLSSRPRTLGIDTSMPSRAARILPEIEIVEDDDPRIVFPESGKSTRVQAKHDHVIRGPFSHALDAQGGAASIHSLGRRVSADHHSGRSVSGSKAPTTIIDEGGGGYLPSRWASGDRQLRVTENDKEKYRPREWGGRHGELGGRSEEWR